MTGGRLGRWYRAVYEFVCGASPNERLPHFQWLAGKDLHRDLRGRLAQLRGTVLDVGCGSKPYQSWMPLVSEHFGVDVVSGSRVDLVISPDRRWELEDGRFDAVICTQVLQYVRNPAQMMDEIARVLKPGGRLLLSVPFAYTHHGVIADYWRYSVDGGSELLSRDFEIEEAVRQGGVGSTIGLQMLNWLDYTMNQRSATRILKALLFPVWLIFCLGVNCAGWLLDACDRRSLAYHNVLVVARKRRV